MLSFGPIMQLKKTRLRKLPNPRNVLTVKSVPGLTYLSSHSLLEVSGSPALLTLPLNQTTNRPRYEKELIWARFRSD